VAVSTIHTPRLDAWERFRETLPDCLLGGLCGGLATWPMTAVMRLLHRQLPAQEQYPLPPRLITMKAAEQLGVKSRLNADERFTITLAAHYAYGAAAGLLYGAIPEKDRWPVAVRGAVFGLAVWTVSYLGLLPGIGLLPSATRQPVRRSALMIAAHLVWGVALSWLTHTLRAKGPAARARTSRSARRAQSASARV
jgi:uncharacterized membrane protein YagU involved in acid resistance